MTDPSRRLLLFVAALLLIGLGRPASAGSEPSAISAADDAFAKIDDYHMTIAVHETDGTKTEDRIYDVLFKKPSMEKVEVTAGPQQGSGVVWLGGDRVKGHRGGMMSGLRKEFDIHNYQVSTLRGDGVDSATIPSMLGDFSRIKGTVSQAPGPLIDGAPTEALTLDVADPPTNSGISRIVLYLSEASHLPVRRERFAGSDLVKTETVTDMKTDVGLTSGDFPW